jgi:hypothetical protein
VPFPLLDALPGVFQVLVAEAHRRLDVRVLPPAAGWSPSTDQRAARRNTGTRGISMFCMQIFVAVAAKNHHLFEWTPVRSVDEKPNCVHH